MSTEHAASPRVYYVVFLVLLACTYLTWQVAYFDLGPLNTLVVLFFMHARTSSRLTWLVVIAGVFWLLILLTLTASDYLTRHWT